MSLPRQILLIAIGMVLGSALTLTGLRLIGEPVNATGPKEAGYQVPATIDKDKGVMISPSPTRDWASALSLSPTVGDTTDEQRYSVATVTSTANPDIRREELLAEVSLPRPTVAATPAPTPIAPTPTPGPLLTNGVHVVQPGDSLMSLASKYGVSTDAILEANDLKQRQFIWMGQELVIPTRTASSQQMDEIQTEAPVASPAVVAMVEHIQVSKAHDATPEPSAKVRPTTHVVQAGETLAKIAQRYGTSIEAIVVANTIPNRDLIEVGEQFVIPLTDVQPEAVSTIEPLRGRLTEPTPTLAPTPMENSRGMPGKVVFQTALGGDIYVVEANGADLTRLTTGMEPCLSPNGQWVAFTRWGEQEGIYAIKADGTEERLIYGVHQPRQPVWSPDGTRIAFAFQNGSRDTETHDREGKLYRHTEYFWRTAVVDIEGKNFTELPSSSNQSFSPTWSPDSQFVAFTGGEGLIVSSPGGFYRELVHGAWYESPAWSPDGGSIAYMIKQHDHFDIFLRPFQGELSDEQPFLRYNKGIEQIALTSPPLFADRSVNNVAPSWSPDGHHIAFLSDRDGWWEIYVMDANGENQHKMFDGTMGGIEITYEFARDRTLYWGK